MLRALGGVPFTCPPWPQWTSMLWPPTWTDTFMITVWPSTYLQPTRQALLLHCTAQGRVVATQACVWADISQRRLLPRCCQLTARYDNLFWRSPLLLCVDLHHCACTSKHLLVRLPSACHLQKRFSGFTVVRWAPSVVGLCGYGTQIISRLLKHHLASEYLTVIAQLVSRRRFRTGWCCSSSRIVCSPTINTDWSTELLGV